MRLRTLSLAFMFFATWQLTACTSTSLDNRADLSLAAKTNASSPEVLLPSADFFLTPPPHAIEFSLDSQERMQKLIALVIDQTSQQANQGNTQKQFELAMMYRFGVLPQGMQQVATDIVSKAHQKPTQVPVYLLKTEQNLEKMLYWMDKAIRSGHKEAIYFYFTFFQERNLRPHYPTIKKALSYAASQGNVDAKLALALTYLNPAWDSNTSPQKALAVFKAYPQEPAALYGLGIMLFNGFDLNGIDLSDYIVAADKELHQNLADTNTQNSLFLVEQASNQDFLPATNLLCGMYLLGEDAPQDRTMTLHYAAKLLRSYPFAESFLTLASTQLLDLNNPQLDNVYGPLIKQTLLDTSYLNTSKSIGALATLGLLGSQNRLGLNLLDHYYFTGYMAKLGLSSAIELDLRAQAIFAKLGAEVETGDLTNALAVMFFYSRAGERGHARPDKALYFVHLAEAAQDQDTLTTLGTLYLLGIDLPFNEEKGLTLLKRAEEAGSLLAPLIMEEYLVYAQGKTTNKFTLSLKLAKQLIRNNPLSLFKLLLL